MPSSDLASPYLDGVSKGVLRYQACLDCGAAQTLERFACHECRSSRLAWRDAVGTGTIDAVTVVTRAPSDSFRALVPYTLVLVTLDEGFRLMAHGRGELKIGERVVMQTFMHDGQFLVVFSSVNGSNVRENVSSA